MESLKDYFQECLEKSAENNPVVLVLDSLDQLSIDHGGRQMDWYPRNLPPNVYAILSTLPGQEHQALPSLRVRYKAFITSKKYAKQQVILLIAFFLSHTLIYEMNSMCLLIKFFNAMILVTSSTMSGGFFYFSFTFKRVIYELIFLIVTGIPNPLHTK